MELMKLTTAPAKLVTPEKMEHNYFEIYKDVILNMLDFFKVFINDDSEDEDTNEFGKDVNNEIIFPLFMYNEPKFDI
jgi:hypothetical protein